MGTDPAEGLVAVAFDRAGRFARRMGAAGLRTVATARRDRRDYGSRFPDAVLDALGGDARRLVLVLRDEEDAPFADALALVEALRPERAVLVSVAPTSDLLRVTSRTTRIAREALEAAVRCTVHAVDERIRRWPAYGVEPAGVARFLLAEHAVAGEGEGLDTLACGSHALAARHTSGADDPELAHATEGLVPFFVGFGALPPGGGGPGDRAVEASGAPPALVASVEGPPGEPPHVLALWTAEPLRGRAGAETHLSVDAASLWRHTGARLAPFFPGRPRLAEPRPAVEWPRPLRERTRELFEELHRAAGEERSPAGERTPTGLPWLDAATGGGLLAGRVTTLHGPIASGRTQLALEVALARAAAGHPVLVVPVLAPAASVTRRLVALASDVPKRRLARGELARVDWVRLARTVGPLSERPVWIASRHTTVETLADLAHEATSRGVRTLVVDGVDTLRSPRPRVLRLLDELGRRDGVTSLLTTSIGQASSAWAETDELWQLLPHPDEAERTFAHLFVGDPLDHDGPHPVPFRHAARV